MRTPLICTAACFALMTTASYAQPGGNGHGNGGGNGGGPKQASQSQPPSKPQQAQNHLQQQKPQKQTRAETPSAAAHTSSAKQASFPKQVNTQKQGRAAEPAGQSRSAQTPGGQQQQHNAKMAKRAEGPVKAQTAPNGKHVADAPAARAPSANTGPAKRADGKMAKGAEGRSFDAARPRRTDIKRVSYDGPEGRKVIVPSNARVRVVTSRRDIDWRAMDRRRAYDGCPPGLAKKYNGCTPPGLDRQPQRSWTQPEWYLSDYDRAYRYRYTDGYMLRLGSGTQILSYIPLLGGALAVGQAWPSSYQSVNIPSYYDSYYDLGPSDSYRYYDDTIYRVDSGNSVIQSIAALLTGNDFTIGQPMPAGYDVYNVPYDYRDQYIDGPDANYRYSDGYIYQVDPTTRLIQAAIELLA